MPDEIEKKPGENQAENAEEKAAASAPEAPKVAAAGAADDLGEGEGDDEEAAAEGDAFRPEAIAKRIESLGSEDETEKLAREEEKKLAERRRAQKKGKVGLQQSASKRLAKIGDKPVKRTPSVARAADADPLLERATKVSSWMKENQKVVAGISAVVVVGLAAVMGFEYLQKKKESDASVVLAEAISDERGIIGDPDKLKTDDGRVKDPRPVFKTVDDRRKAALDKYKEVETRFSGTGAAMLARLGEASILLDKHDADGALAAYNDVKNSPLAQADVEVRGRALEGVGFAYELKATLKPEEKNQDLDEAMKAFKDLENLDQRGFKELGMYHEARVFEAKGDKPKAIEVLGALRAKLQEKNPADREKFPYLDTAVDDRLATLDPAAVPRKPPARGMGAMGGGGMGGLEDLLGGGNIDMNDPRVQEIIRNLGGGGGGMPPPGGGAPPGRPPAPPPSPKK